MPRQMGAARRERLAARDDVPAMCRLAYQHRAHAAGTPANPTGYGGGLQPPPSVVRRLGRVTR